MFNSYLNIFTVYGRCTDWWKCKRFTMVLCVKFFVTIQNNRSVTIYINYFFHVCSYNCFLKYYCNWTWFLKNSFKSCRISNYAQPLEVKDNYTIFMKNIHYHIIKRAYFLYLSNIMIQYNNKFWNLITKGIQNSH